MNGAEDAGAEARAGRAAAAAVAAESISGLREESIQRGGGARHYVGAD